MPVRVVFVDDHPVVREGLRAIFLDAGMEIAGEAADGRTAFFLIRKALPEVAVVDAALPGLSGIELCRRVRRHFPNVHVVLISMFDDPVWRVEAARAGAAAYVLKGEDPNVLLDAVRRAAQGQSLLHKVEGQGLPLTAREREVVQLIAEGKKLSEIAQILCRSRATVRAHKASAMKKLGVHSTSELVRRALEHGIVRTLKLTEESFGCAL